MASAIPQSELDALARGVTTVAITGTNGKTTTTSMIARIARAAGQRVARVTTLGMWVDDEQTADDGSMVSFVRTLRRARELGARTLALEVTSRALEAGFANRWPPHVAVFTNLSHDHLDRHGTAERYLAAKAQLFVHLRRGGVAVLNARDPASALLAEVVPAETRVLRFDPRPDDDVAAGAELSACGVTSDAGGSRIALRPGSLARALGHALRVGTPGEFNVDNALAAALAAHAAELPAAAIAQGLAAFRGVEGRFQVVHDAPLCVIDFAHTPDALSRALQGARRLARERGGRLACVFGCGGERDAGKRAPMGAAADAVADAVWLTSDNPRSEAPAEIARAVRAGARGRARWHELPERAEAIADALAWAGARDVVLVAGRGHERVQQLGDAVVPASDAELLRAALAARR